MRWLKYPTRPREYFGFHGVHAIEPAKFAMFAWITPKGRGAGERLGRPRLSRGQPDRGALTVQMGTRIRRTGPARPTCRGGCSCEDVRVLVFGAVLVYASRTSGRTLP